MKKLIGLCLFLAGCAPQYTPNTGPPRVALKIGLTANVEQHHPFTLVLQGSSWPETVGLEIYVDGEYVGGKGGIWAEKRKPIEDKLYIQRLWYMEKAMGFFPRKQFRDASTADGYGDVEDEDTVTIRVKFMLFEVEPHPTKPMQWKRGKVVAAVERPLRLYCWNCRLD